MARDPRVRVRIDASDRISPVVNKVEGRFRRFSRFLSTRFVVTATGALNAVRAIFAQIEKSATLESQTEALKRNLASQGFAFDAYIAKLNEVSRGQISTAKLIESSSKALLLGIPAEEIAGLLEIARASAIATGTSVSQAFDDIATGIGRASPLILDNLGIVVKLGPAYEAAAQALGKATEELTAQEQKQALLNEVLRVGKDRVELFGDAQSALSANLQQGTAALENFKIGLGGVASGVALAAAALVTRGAAGFVFLASTIAEVVSAITGLLARLPIVGEAFEGISDSALRTGSRLRKTFRDMVENANALSSAADTTLSKMLGLSDAADTTTDAIVKVGGASRDTAEGLDTLGTKAEEVEEGFLDGAQAVGFFADAERDATRAGEALATTMERQALIWRTNPDFFRGDFARQAAERRRRLSGSSIGEPLFGFQDPLISGGGPSGGTFTTIRFPRATPDGGIFFP